MAESEEELKNLLMKVTDKNEKNGLKINIKKTRIMSPGPITSWQIDKKWKQRQILFSWFYLKSLWTITAAMKLKDSCSLEVKLSQT